VPDVLSQNVDALLRWRNVKARK